MIDKKATQILEETLIGSFGPFPRNVGNCFSLLCDDGSHYRVVNFIVENLRFLLKDGTISFPVDIKAISDRQAVIHDVRIPDNFYASRYCEVCCPHDLLPLPQKLAFERKVKSGEIEIIEGENGKIIKQNINATVRELKTKYTCETSMDEGFFYTQNVPNIIIPNEPILIFGQKKVEKYGR